MIVKDEYLRTNLINDIEFKKTAVQLDEWAKEEEKRLDDERPRKCPKCFHDFIPKDTKFGDCHYHDGFIVDCEKPQEHLTADRARAIMQHVAMLREEEENKPLKTPFPKFLWACCGQRYSDNQMGCRTSSCGLPEELEGEVDMRIVDYMAKVQEHFMNNPDAIDKLSQIIQNYKLSRKSVAGTSTTISTGRSNSSYFTTTPK
jgi:histone deacetylase complex regulatory component SIN3